MKTQVTILLASLHLGGLLLPTSPALDITKTNNTDALDLTTSWVGEVVPTGFDTAIWDNTVATASSAPLGTLSAQWFAIKVLDPANDFTITGSPGVTLELTSTSTGIDLSTATRDLTLNCDLIPGNNQVWDIAAGRTLILGGDIQFPSAGNVAKKRGDGTLRLTGGQVTSLGNLWLERGATLLTGGNDRLPTLTILRVGGINGPTAVLDLGGGSHSIGRMLYPATDTTNAHRGFITNGTLVLQGENGSGNTVFYAGNESQMDFSGVDLLSVSLNSSALRNFSTQPFQVAGTGTAEYNATNTVILAKTNVIRGNMGVGGSGTSGGLNNLGCVRLGAENDLRLNQLTIGGFNARGRVDFQDGLSNPTLKIRGTDGSSRLPTWNIGDTSSGTRAGGGTLDVSPGNVDILAANLRLGRAGAANSFATENSRFRMSAGTVDILDMVMGVKFASGFTNENVIANFDQLGGAVKISTLVMGTNAETGGTYTSSSPNWQLGYNLGGGTFRAAKVFAGPGTNGPNSVRALNWTNGTIQNYDVATDLLITNHPALSNGVVVYAPGAGSRSFNPDSGRSIIIAAALKQDSASATPVGQSGGGTLELAGDQNNAFAGLDVTAGTVILNKASSGSVHALGNDSTLNGGILRLAGSGGDQIADVAAIAVNSGTFDLNGQVETIAGLAGTGGAVASASPATLTLSPADSLSYSAGAGLSGSFNLIKSGAGRQTYLGIDSRSAGTNAVEAGVLVIGNGATLAGITYIHAAGTLMGNGTVAGSTTVAGGTVAPGASIGKLTFSGGLTLQPSATLIMELDRSLHPAATNDSLAVSGGFTVNGTLNVVNLGPALVAGDKFTLFNSAVSGFATVNLPTGYTWQNDLAVDGSITVTAVTSSAPELTFEREGNDLIFTWAPATGFQLQAQTNALNVGLDTNESAWFNYPGGSSSPVVVPVTPANPAVFFRLKSTP